MACNPFCLRTMGLTGADAGGTWTNPDGNYSGTLTGDDPCVEWSQLSQGNNQFVYTLTGCDGNPATATVNLYVLQLGQVNAYNATVCEDDAVINLQTAMGIVVGPDGQGAWSGSTANPGWTEPSFNPAASGVGTFTFTYTITPNNPQGYTDLGCCDPITATATIIVTAGSNAGSGGNFAGC